MTWAEILTLLIALIFGALVHHFLKGKGDLLNKPVRVLMQICISFAVFVSVQITLAYLIHILGPEGLVNPRIVRLWWVPPFCLGMSWFSYTTGLGKYSSK